MTSILIFLLLLPVPPEVTQEVPSKAWVAGRRAGQARGAGGAEEEPTSRSRKRPREFAIREPGVSVSARFDPERGIYHNKGRWITEPDGIYLEPSENTVYVIASRANSAPAAADSAALVALSTAAFETLRRHASQTCPSKLKERLRDPVFEEALKARYETARASQQNLLNKPLSYEQYLANLPDCEVGGSLWRQSTRFGALDSDAGSRRILVRFSNDLRVRPVFAPPAGENHLPVLKDWLKSTGRIIRFPLMSEPAPDGN